MDNRRIKLRVMGLSYSQLQSGAHILILAEVNGPRRIPVVIGSPEAQSIAIKMEGIIPPRPVTHDLFASFVHAFGVSLKEVFIYKFEDGIFSSEMTFTDGERTVVLDARTSDAIAIAMRVKCNIYTTPEIIEETGFLMEVVPTEENPNNEDDKNMSEEVIGDDDSMRLPRPENYTIEELERTLNQLIDREDYEEASKIKAILDRKRNKLNTNE